MAEGLGYVFGGEGIDGDREVGEAVEGKATLVAGFEVGAVGEDRAVGFGAVAADEDGFEGGIKVDKMRAGSGEQEVARARVFDGSAAKAQDKAILTGQLPDGLVFELAKVGLAVSAEDFGDGETGGRFDFVVDVAEGPVQVQGEEPAYGAFAGSHKSGEDDAL